MQKIYQAGLVAFLLCFVAVLSAQKPNYHWASKFDIADSEITDYEGGPLVEMLVDRKGNSYLLGGFQEGLQLDAQTYLAENPDGAYQWFLAKFNTKGKLEWYRILRESAEGAVTFYDMALDTQNNIILGGFSDADTTYLGRGDYFLSTCKDNGFCENLLLVKISSGGELISNQSLTAKGAYFYDMRMSLDGQDNTLLNFFLGSADTLVIANRNFRSLPEDAIVTCKLDRQGNVLWVKQGEQVDAFLQIFDISAQNDGSLWVFGEYDFGDEVSFGDDFHLQNLPEIDPVYGQNYLLKYAPNGDIEWLSELNGEFVYSRMVAGKGGDIYLVGVYQGLLYYNGRVVLSDLGLNPNPEEDFMTFVIKLDQEGRIMWKKQLPQVAPYCNDFILTSSFIPFRSWSVDAQGRLLSPLYYVSYQPGTTLQIEDRTIELTLTYEDDEDSMYEWGGLVRIDKQGALEWIMDFPLDEKNHFYPHLVRPGPNETFYLQGAMYIDSLRLGSNVLVTDDFVSSVLTRFDFSVSTKRPSPADRPLPRPPVPIGESQLQAPLLSEIQVFPNPAHDRLNIQLKQPISLESMQIRDQLGRVLWRSEGREDFMQAEIELKNLVPGMYTLELFTAQQKLNYPFIKQ